MKRCLALAKLGSGHVSPNPMVGAVIVFNNKIIGEGYHQEYGKAHAEVNAIAAVKDKSLLLKSTIYVSLEPCNHVGKTPACSDLILKYKIPRVVIAMEDPFELVAGSGIQKLKDAGVEVCVGVLEQEAKDLNKVFTTFHLQKRPFVEIKYAQTADGFIAKADGQPVSITNKLANLISHKHRAKIGAIAIGFNTALNDNPSLTPRLYHGNQPLRIVFDEHNKLPNHLQVFTDDTPTLLVTRTASNRSTTTYYKELVVPNHEHLIHSTLNWLYENNVAHLLVEGGSKLIQQFLKENVVDGFRIFTNPNLTLKTGIKAPIFEPELKHIVHLKDQYLEVSK